MKQFFPEEFFAKMNIKDKDLWSDKTLEKEYNRQAKEYNKRLSRIEKNYPRAKTLEEHEKAPSFEEFKKGEELDRTSLSSQLNEMYKFNKTDSTLMKGFRKQLKLSIASFNRTFSPKDEEGNVVESRRPFNSKNIWDLYDFLDEYSEMNKEQIMPKSEEVVDIFVEARRLNMDLKSLAKNMNYWKDHFQEMQELEPVRSDSPVPSSEYEKLLYRR